MSLEGQSSTDILGRKQRRHRLSFIGAAPERLLVGIEAGRLTVVTPSGQRIEHRAPQDGPEAVLVFHKWRALRRLVTGGDIGFAEAYVAGEWSSPDLAALIRILVKNCDYLERAILGWVPARAVNRVRHPDQPQLQNRQPSQHRLPLRSGRFLSVLA